jgi:hypothetical protein
MDVSRTVPLSRIPAATEELAAKVLIDENDYEGSTVGSS